MKYLICALLVWLHTFCLTRGFAIPRPFAFWNLGAPVDYTSTPGENFIQDTTEIDGQAARQNEEPSLGQNETPTGMQTAGQHDKHNDNPFAAPAIDNPTISLGGDADPLAALHAAQFQAFYENLKLLKRGQPEASNLTTAPPESKKSGWSLGESIGLGIWFGICGLAVFIGFFLACTRGCFNCCRRRNRYGQRRGCC